MRVFGIIFAGIIGLCWPLSAWSQEDKILKEQVETIFRDLRAADRKMLTEECLRTWNASFLSAAEKDSVSTMFKKLQDLRMPATSELKFFAENINNFCRKEEKENLLVWLEGLKQVMRSKEKQKTNIRNYLSLTHGLICRDILYRGKTHLWLANGETSWKRDSVIEVCFKNAKLCCKTPKDSIFVYGTELLYKLNTRFVEGKGGKVYWQSPDTLYAELSAYGIDMDVSDYQADSVQFVYEKKFCTPLWGSLKDNALKYARNKENKYPQFTSYSTDIEIDSVFRGISFRGGINYNGTKLSGFGEEGKPACLDISPNDTIHLFLYSKRFSIDTARIIAGMAEMVLPLDSGRFYHPEVNFSYTSHNHTVVIKRITEQSLHVPFRDDYHQILFNVEQIIWPVDSVSMEMQMNSRSGLFKATVESLNFFDDNIYDRMQGIDEIHPLNGLHKASARWGRNTFTLSEYADFVRKPIDQLRRQIIALSYEDFVGYNASTDEVTLKQRLFDYTRARVGLKDYDNIRFASHPKDSRINAVLHLKNYNLKIFGVDRFTISTVKDIYVEPSDKCVVMLKNRDMEFNGKLKAGMFDMFGNKLYFSYDKYTIDLTQVDSTGMYLADKGSGKRGRKVNSLIRDVTGDIVIDKPNNKSGKKKNSGFPVFNSTKESYVYFDDPAIRDGVYKKEKFYFIIQPYTLKNINDSEKFRYAFSGTLVSHILPDIKDTLLLMNDNTLGMAYETPGEGLELYGKGKLKSKVQLNQQGFIADGKVDLNASNFRSPSIVLMPDSMLCRSDLLTVEGIPGQRPAAKGKKVAIKYWRQDNNLQAMSGEIPFEVYNARIRHSGTLFVYEDLLNASGKLELEGARLDASLFRLEENNVLSDRTALQLSSFANKNIQLNTSNVTANLDLIQNKGKFMNNEDANMADFPSNKYKCSFKSFTWYMKEAYLNIGIEDEKELQRIWQIEDIMRMPEQGKNVFVSTDKACDSLHFMAPLAKYNLNTGDIHCQWVNHIDLANGRFYPDYGKIYINSNGDIQEFKNGTFLCNLEDKGKTLYKVNLKLKGFYTFNGGGDFDYVNQDRRKNLIHFTEIGTDTSRHIYARVNIRPEDGFYLNEGITYQGDIFMFSKEKDLFFKGYTRLTADDTYLKHTWLKVKTYFEAQDVRIPVEIENRDDKDRRIFNGVFLNVDKTVQPYAAFNSSRRFYNDELLLGGKGEMVWDSLQQKYVITDTNAGKHYRLCYTPSVHTVSGFGKLGMELKIPGISQRMSGDISYNLKEEELNVGNVLYCLDFRLLNKIENILLKDFTDKRRKSIVADSSLVAKLETFYGKGLLPLALKQLHKNSNNIPDSLDAFFVLDSLNFTWDAQRRSYVSKGEVLVRSIRKRPVEQKMNIAMELVRRRSGNEIYVYIYDDQKWYYFEYTDRSLYTVSSNAEYNEALKNEKADKKIVRDKEKQTLYTITLCPDSKKGRFMKRMGI